MLESLKVALVHDVLINTGGAERVVAAFSEVFPEAPIYTCAYHPERTFPIFREREIRAFLPSSLPQNERLVKWMLPLLILATETMDFRGFDLVLSSSTFLVKGILTPSETCHVSYIHNVFRLLWMKGTYGLGGTVVQGVLLPLRLWDLAASRRPDFVITNSRVTMRRIRKYYRRKATVLHPPIDLSQYEISRYQDDYFLVVSRLEPYKRVDIAVEAFSRLGLRLVVVGEGSVGKMLRKKASRNVEFLGNVTDELLRELYSKAQAVVFPGEEDFGLVPLEAQASGRPVIAYGAGGVLETVTSYTGVFFRPQTSEALARAVEEFGRRTFDPDRIRAHASRFDKAKFAEDLRKHLFRFYTAFHGEKLTPSAHGPFP